MSYVSPSVDDYRDTDGLLRGDLERYSANLIRIKDKSGRIVPFTWNRAQRRLHAKIERQREEKGRVRVLVLKARQLGISTYICARLYHKTTLWLGQSTYILTHDDKATQNLFNMAKRVHDHMPADYRLNTRASNAKELLFADGVDGGYAVGTAGNIHGAGRSLTVQNFHGSEVAFWADAQTHFSGVMQAVGMIDGTEVALESTANGVGGTFYSQWHLAERKQSDFIGVFLPWFINLEYAVDPTPDFDLSHEEAEYAELHGLDERQMFWLRLKNLELGAKPGEICFLFMQEYPATAQEAFQTSGEQTLIDQKAVLRARQREILEPDDAAPRILGVDIAAGGGDYTRLIDREGNRMGKVVNETMNERDTMLISERIGLRIKEHRIDHCFIDKTGIGWGVVDRLHSMGFQNKVTGVMGAQTPGEPDKFFNKRAECWGRLQNWVEDIAGPDIPDEDDIHRHLCAPKGWYDEKRRLHLEPKEKMVQRIGFSPDAGDAAALTFAETVVKPLPRSQSWQDKAGPKRDFMTR